MSRTLVSGLLVGTFFALVLGLAGCDSSKNSTVSAPAPQNVTTGQEQGLIEGAGEATADAVEAAADGVGEVVEQTEQTLESAVDAAEKKIAQAQDQTVEVIEEAEEKTQEAAVSIEAGTQKALDGPALTTPTNN